MSKFSSRNSVGIKLLVIAGLSLLLLIPAFMVEDIVYERNFRKEAAQNEVSDKWGNSQTISGPILSVPFNKFVKNNNGNIVKITHYAHFLPDVLNIESDLKSERRYRGIYELAVYNAKIKITGMFSPPDFADMDITDKSINWSDAVISFGISDMKGIKELVDVKINGIKGAVSPGVTVKGLLQSGINIKPHIVTSSQQLEFTIDLDLNGSNSLLFTPVGKETNVTLESNWNNPSFDGAFLPYNRKISEEGFSAKWKVLYLNRNYPQKWIDGQFKIDKREFPQVKQLYRGTMPTLGTSASEFGVNLRVTVDEYQKTTRTVKYAIMFISLTFLTFFMIELLGSKSVHPIQYLLIGFGLLIFYTLLLSFSEHISFEISYLIASTGIIVLISLYTKSIFKENKFVLLVTGVLILLYGYMYVILQLQDYALLMGSIGLFIILGLLMYLTRNIDWFSVMKKDDMLE